MFFTPYPTPFEMESDCIPVKMAYSTPAFSICRSWTFWRSPGLVRYYQLPPHLSDMAIMAIRVTFFNVHGLNHPAKCASVWRKALKLHSDILCIQETHWLASNAPSFTTENVHIYSQPQLLKNRKGSSLSLETLWLSLSWNHTQIQKEGTRSWWAHLTVVFTL